MPGDKKPPIPPDRARALLSGERERIESELAGLDRQHKGDVAAGQDERNLEDTGERIEEESVDDAVAQSLKKKLQAIERAEKRVEDGTYGLSVVSGEPIPEKRLEAIPWAERTKDEEEK